MSSDRHMAVVIGGDPQTPRLAGVLAIQRGASYSRHL